MQPFMNLFDFAGEELADISAFLHDDGEQHKFSEADIPPDIMPVMSHMHEDSGGAAEHAEALGHGDPDGEDHDDAGTGPHDD